MPNPTTVYLDFFTYDISDYIECEMECGSRAVDIHHIEKRNKTRNDFVENLIALCRDCHIKAESDPCFNQYCRVKHLENTCIQIVALIQLNKQLNEYRKNSNK